VTPAAGIQVAPGLLLDADYVGGGAFVIAAKRGAGKTYLARVLCEEFWRCRVPFVALDPMGAMWGLRSAADGAGAGLPVPIFGGDHGDVPLERGGGAVLADLAVAERMSMIVDMSRLGSRAAEREFAHAFLDRLYRTNRDLVHVLIDEADLFAPQKPAPGDQPLLGVTENIVRRGRNKGIGISLLTQRLAVLNKDVATQADGLVPMRITGLQDREAIDAWVRGHADDDEARPVKASLASLANGECWWWVPELGILRRAQIRRARTFDSSPTRRRGDTAAAPKTIADVDLGAIAAKMAATIERAKADDPRELRRVIAGLRADLAARPPLEQREPAEIHVPVITDDARTALLAAAGEVEGSAAVALAAIEEAAAQLGKLAEQIGDPARPGQRPGPRLIEYDRGGRRPQATPRSAPAPAPAAPRPTDDDPAMRAGARRMLAAVASLHPMPLTRAQTAALAKVKRTGGTFSTYLGVLKQAGYITEAGGMLSITGAGFAALGTAPPAPATAEELRAMWRDRLRAGAVRMLDILIAAYPAGLTRDELAEASEISRGGGTFSTYLGMLRTAGLIAEADGQVRADDVLFLGAKAP